jgi:mRNA-degrading endonuclease toxin of MazEF toxin-antitoxin module
VIRQGSIIRAKTIDPQGFNPKIRPLLVVSPNEDISATGPIVCIAVTGRFSEPLADDEVALPFHSAGAANSGLRKPSVAKCSWSVTIGMDDIVDRKGFVSKERLTAVLTRIADLERCRKQQ